MSRESADDSGATIIVGTAASTSSDSVSWQSDLWGLMSMGSNYSKTPHVCFKVERPLSAGANDELPQLLECQLHALFDSVKMKKTRSWLHGLLCCR